MEIEEAEDLLVGRLEGARDTASLHALVLDSRPPSTFGEMVALGLDTNVLKSLRREIPFADQLFLTLQASSVALIVPAQVITEYWNNHQVFASDEWNLFRSDLAKLSKRAEAQVSSGSVERRVLEIRSLLDEIEDDLQGSKTPEYLERSKELIRSLLETAKTPRVSRARLAELAHIRLASKTPPGFADERSKASAAGDFFVWCDFLLGALCVPAQAGRSKDVWVTEDSKPDWKTGGEGHPALLEEFKWVCGGDLSIVSLSAIRLIFDAGQLQAAADSLPVDASIDVTVVDAITERTTTADT